VGESLESKAGAGAGGWECGVQPGLCRPRALG